MQWSLKVQHKPARAFGSHTKSSSSCYPDIFLEFHPIASRLRHFFVNFPSRGAKCYGNYSIVLRRIVLHFSLVCAFKYPAWPVGASIYVFIMSSPRFVIVIRTAGWLLLTLNRSLQIGDAAKCAPRRNVVRHVPLLAYLRLLSSPGNLIVFIFRTADRFQSLIAPMNGCATVDAASVGALKLPLFFTFSLNQWLNYQG